jgi:PRTRC genetic system protein E
MKTTLINTDMKTNFFENIANLNTPGIWKLAIQVDANGNFTVSELFTALNCGDNAAKLIIPMNLCGTAQDLDEGFFDKVTEPLPKTAELYTNMEAHLKSVEAAKTASKMEQDKKNKEKAKTAPITAATKGEADQEMPEPKEEKKKKYEGIMKSIAELNDRCKYEEALELLPTVEEYPEKENELKNKRADLIRKKELMSQATLAFNS